MTITRRYGHPNKNSSEDYSYTCDHCKVELYGDVLEVLLSVDKVKSVECNNDSWIQNPILTSIAASAFARRPLKHSVKIVQKI